MDKQPDANLDGEMKGVREYSEGQPVILNEIEDGRYEIVAFIVHGHRCTAVDLGDLVDWLRAHRPELLEGEPRNP